jgi:Calcineurin-like phosphoesterase
VVDVVIGDVHARADALLALLAAVGAVDERGRRRGRWWIVQVGDLLDRHETPEANLRTARLAADTLDLVLAGNHEAAMLREPASAHGAALATLAARGWPHAAAAPGGWLVTHAGVHADFARELPAGAADCAEELNDRWHRRARDAEDPLFDSIGIARGGAARHGGILWMHTREWPRGGEAPWGQIAGHVPQRRPRLLAGRRWAIDLGGTNGRLAALVRPRGEERWQPVIARVQRGRAVAA